MQSELFPLADRAVVGSRWWVDYGTLYLDYGYDFALREIRGVRVRGRYLQGDLYLDGEYIDYIELQMQ